MILAIYFGVCAILAIIDICVIDAYQAHMYKTPELLTDNLIVCAAFYPAKALVEIIVE